VTLLVTAPSTFGGGMHLVPSLLNCWLSFYRLCRCSKVLTFNLSEYPA